MKSMEIQSGHSELSIISQMSAVEGWGSTVCTMTEVQLIMTDNNFFLACMHHNENSIQIKLLKFSYLSHRSCIATQLFSGTIRLVYVHHGTRTSGSVSWKRCRMHLAVSVTLIIAFKFYYFSNYNASI